MRNPTYSGAFHPSPMPERCISMRVINEGNELPQVTLSVGVKTITNNRDGLKLYPHQVVAVEISCGDEMACFDMPPSFARTYAKRLIEFADNIEGNK